MAETSGNNNKGEDLFQQATEKRQAQQWKECYELLKEAVNVYSHPEACVSLGKCYDAGEGVKADPEKAFSLYKKAVDLGSVNGLFNVGACYRAGVGVKKNDKEAFSYFSQALSKGYIAACVNIGAMYLKGEGVKQNTRKSIEFFQMGINNNIPAAMFNLANIYISGGPKKEKEGIELMKKAAYAGHAAAGNKLKQLGINEQPSSFTSSPHLKPGDAKELIVQLQSVSDEVKLRAAKPIAFLIDGHQPNLDVLIGDSLCPALVAAFNNENDELLEWLVVIIEHIVQSTEEHKQILTNAGILKEVIKKLKKEAVSTKLMNFVFLLLEGSQPRKNELESLGMKMMVENGECQLALRPGSFAATTLQPQ